MNKSGLISQRYTANSEKEQLKDITSLTLSNYGETEITVTINNQSRKVPAFNPTIGVPFGSFNIQGDGTACDIDITIEFAGGTGECILDYRKFKTC